MITPIIGLLLAVVGGWGAWKLHERRMPAVATISGVVAIFGLMLLIIGPTTQGPNELTPTARAERERLFALDDAALENLGKVIDSSGEFRAVEISVRPNMYGGDRQPGNIRAIVGKGWKTLTEKERRRIAEKLWERWLDVRRPNSRAETSIKFVDTGDRDIATAAVYGIFLADPNKKDSSEPAQPVEFDPTYGMADPNNRISSVLARPTSSTMPKGCIGGSDSSVDGWATVRNAGQLRRGLHIYIRENPPSEAPKVNEMVVLGGFRSENGEQQVRCWDCGLGTEAGEIWMPLWDIVGNDMRYVRVDDPAYR